jgi:hypothetical protein
MCIFLYVKIEKESIAIFGIIQIQFAHNSFCDRVYFEKTHNSYIKIWKL